MIQYALADFYQNETTVNNYYLLNNYVYEWALKETYDILSRTKLLLSKPGGAWYIFVDFINYRNKLKHIKKEIYFTKKGIKKNYYLLLNQANLK